MKIPFWKYHGTGNDFILMDNRDGSLTGKFQKETISSLCDRHFGIGADGLIFLESATKADFQMRYFNSDGGESSMCGNGGRCLVAFADLRGIKKESYRFIAIDGMHEAWPVEEGIRLKMGTPHRYIRLTSNREQVDTGSPHYVWFRTRDVDKIDLVSEARAIRYANEYKEEGINVNFVNTIDPGKLRVRTYERGVEDETLSCGTGVTACAYTFLQQQGREGVVEVQTRGGSLQVEISEGEVFLTGPAVFVFEGSVDIP
jgi:diaminopimelate epimerase